MAACAHEAQALPHGSMASGVSPASNTAPGHAPAGAAGASHLLTAVGHEDASVCEWYWYPKGLLAPHLPGGPAGSTDGGRSGAGGSAAHSSAPHNQQAAHAHANGGAGGDAAALAGTPDETGRLGPISKEQICKMWASGEIGPRTLFWAAGLPQPQSLGSIRELRWLVSGGRPVMGVVDTARIALQLLSALVHLQPAVDETGAVLQPLPRVQRTLSGPACLPHLCQVGGWVVGCGRGAGVRGFWPPWVLTKGKCNRLSRV